MCLFAEPPVEKTLNAQSDPHAHIVRRQLVLFRGNESLNKIVDIFKYPDGSEVVNAIACTEFRFANHKRYIFDYRQYSTSPPPCGQPMCRHITSEEDTELYTSLVELFHLPCLPENVDEQGQLTSYANAEMLSRPLAFYRHMCHF